MLGRKGLELDMMGYLIVGLVGIIVLLMFLIGPFSSSMKKTFCFFYENTLKQTSDFCKGINVPVQSISVCRQGCDQAAESREEFARWIAAYAISCWKEQRVKISNSTVCYTLYVEDSYGSVAEDYITSIMEKEGGCEVLENSVVITPTGQPVDYSGNCGQNDNIIWQVSGNAITDQQLILIKYDTNENKIVIIA
ncbi:MAG: hypothetical protein V1944_00375 [Candidatus Aenigmatarchaeota archaeon]